MAACVEADKVMLMCHIVHKCASVIYSVVSMFP